MAKPNRLFGACSLCALLNMSALAYGDKLSDQRAAYLQAEKYLNDKNEAGFNAVSAALADYPLYPYLRYLHQKNHLADTSQVQAFLSAYKNTRYADMLRGKWLDYLAAKGRWRDFILYYQTDDKSADDCRYHWALHQTGKQVEALADAKRLWLNGKAAEKHCQPLFAALEKSPQINQELIWQRLETALHDNQEVTAQAASALLKGDLKARADTWLLLHSKPALIDEPKYWAKKDGNTGRLFAHTVVKLASKNLEKAIATWDGKHKDFVIEPASADRASRKLGMNLLYGKDNRSYNYLNALHNPDADDRVSKVRAALLEQDWQHVEAALLGLMAEQKKQSQWQYWQARMLEQTGRKQQAQAIYQALANERNYYGFIAAEKLDKPYRIPHIPVQVDGKAVDNLAAQPDFQAAYEFKQVGNALELRRQWRYALNKLAKQQFFTAAKLAQQWQMHQFAITALVKADYWDDLSIRFPIAYQNEIEGNADANGLHPALLFGLMRQESMLEKDIVSPAGARGLMQIMPATASLIAKSINEPMASANDLFKPEVNIRFGSWYLNDMLQNTGGQAALAIAAYNAGLHRVKKWLPKAGAVPADIWIETIPFTETRNYVSLVLSYAIIYQDRLKKKGLSLKALLKDVALAEKLG